VVSVSTKHWNTGEQTVIDISDTLELKRIEETDAYVIFGAGVTVEAFRETLVRHYPGAQEYLLSFARYLSETGIPGGNLANASSVGDIMPLLLALEAELELVSLGSNRKVPLPISTAATIPTSWTKTN